MVGTYTFTVTGTDLKQPTELTIQLTVMTDPDNAPPVFDSEPLVTAQVGQPYSYVLASHDPEQTPLTYQLLAGPAGLQLLGGELTWTPQANDAGEHAVLVRVTDAAGAAAVQRYTLSVLGSPLRFVNAPALLASVGTQYRYEPEVLRATGEPELNFYFEKAVAGMQLDVQTGLLLWTPTAAQIGYHEVVLAVNDEFGHLGRFFFAIEVIEASVVPRIISEPVTTAVLAGQYRYDVNAEDLGEREVLHYELVEYPQGMTIDLTTGLISWQPSALGTYPVTVKVTDSAQQTDEQSFEVQVVADTAAPNLELSSTVESIAPGGSAVITVSTHDDVAVATLVVTVDGEPVALDGNGQYVFTSTDPGVHTVVVTVTDSSNNVTSQTMLIGVQDAADTQPPELELSSPGEDAELTYVHDIVGTASDPNLMGYELALRRIEPGAEFRRIGGGLFPVSAAPLGTLDTTLLENGYYELRVSAHDVNGRAAEVVRPVRVDGQAKLGPVQLSFVDMAVPMAGIPITVVRSYDSRDAGDVGDFGYGWKLDVQQGSAQHNRPVGEGMLIFNQEGEFIFPCQGVYEQKSHFTEVRLSERERYIFRPFIANTEAVSGACEGEVFFELVEGTTAGAELHILGGLGETRVRAPALPIVSNPEVLPPSDLTYAFDPERGVFNPGSLRLELRDGRKFDVTVGGGIVRVEDRNGNAVSFTSNGVHHSGGKSVFFERDAQGRITRITDPLGRSVQYAYDLRGDLIRVTDPVQRITRFTYREDPAHYLDTIVGPDGAEVAALQYDASGRLSGTCDADGGCTHSSYDLEARTLVQTDASSRAVTYEYDARGNVVSQTDALGHTVEFAYDGDDNLIRAEGPDGSVATYTYDGSGNMLTRVLPHEADEDPADFTYTYTYSARNDRETVTLPSGGVIDFDYDEAGNLSAVKDGAGNVIESRTHNADGTLATRTDRFGTVVYGAYHSSGQPTQVTDPLGALIELLYDDSGRLLSRTERGVTTNMAYDDLGRIVATDYGNGAMVHYEYGDLGDARWTAIEGPTLGRVERTFSASGRLSSWREPNGDDFTRLYDASGRVEEEIDALGNRTVYGYDAAGRLETITDVTLNATTTFERDAAGRVTRTVDALNNETRTAYKLGGRLRSTTNARNFTTFFERSPLQSAITDALTRTTVTSLTAFGLPASTQYPDLTSTGSSYLGTTRLDESQSFPTRFADELQRERTFGYDARSGLQSATDLAGLAWTYTYAPSQGAAITYDVFSGEVGTAHHQGGAQAYRFGGGGTEYRDVATVDNDGAVSGGGFAHPLRTVTSPLGETTQFIRGRSGRIERVVYPDGGEKLIGYGDDAQPDQVTLPQGTVLTYTHDAALRETARTSSLGEQRAFTYGPGDRIETMTDDTGTTSYEYDAAGRFTGIVYPHGGSVRYDRDVLDRVIAVRVKATATAPDSVTGYVYDENGNLEQITDPLGGITQYVYDEVDRLVERTLPNGVTTTYGYDDRDRVLSVVHRSSGGTVLASVEYERSASGEPTKITREDGSYVVLTYDAALRVDTEAYYDESDALVDAIDYDYDLDGNRTSKNSLSGGFESYAYEPGFKLTSITTASGTESYGYDGGGRNTSIVRGAVSRTLEYNSDDKVTRVLDGGSEVVAYSYDGAGRRVGKVQGGASVRYLVAPNLGDGFETPQAVTDGSGNVLASYVFAGEHPIARIVDGQVEYYLQDAMGSVIGMADASGASTASIKYDAFGNVTSSSGSAAAIPGSVGTDFRYHGMQLDAASGLYHVRARTYDARTGRFTSRDPVAGVSQRPESIHPYIFNSNNPHVWRDPSGTFSLIEVAVVVAVVGVLAASAVSLASSFAGVFAREPKAKNVLSTDVEESKRLGGLTLCGVNALMEHEEFVKEPNQRTLNWRDATLDSGTGLYSRDWDAVGHCIFGCIACQRCDATNATYLGHLYENMRDLGWSPLEKARWPAEHDSSAQDRYNQAVGRRVAVEYPDCTDGCAAAFSSGRLDLSAPLGEYIEGRAPQ